MNMFLTIVAAVCGISIAGMGVFATADTIRDHLKKLKKEKAARKNLSTLLASAKDDAPSDPAFDAAFGSEIKTAKNRMWLQGINPRRDRRCGNPRTNAYRKSHARPNGYETPPAPPQQQFNRPPRKPA